MLNLASTSDLLKVTTGSAGTIEVHATWVDLLTTTGAVTPGRTNTADISSAATTTVVASPAASTIRNVKLLSVRNSHASVSNAITVSHTDGTTEQILWKGTLAPDESVVYSEATGWIRLNAAGAPVTATANLTGGIEVSSGDVQLDAVRRVPNILFYGDSIPGYGNSEKTFGIMSSSITPFGGSAFSVAEVSWSSGSGSGTLNFDKTAKTLNWSPAAGGGFGSPVNVALAGVYDVPGPVAGQFVRVICRPRYYAAATEGDFTVTVTANTERNRKSAKNIATWARVLQNNAFNAYILSNGGSTMADITEAAHQIESHPVAFDEIIVIAGTNDLSSDPALSVLQADATALYSKLVKHSPLVRPVTLLPRTATMTAAKRQKLWAFNRWLLSEYSRDGVVPINASPYVLDVTSTNGDPITGTLEDGLHPATGGAYRLGKMIGAAIMSGRQSRPAFESTSIADAYHATNNPRGNVIAAFSGFTGTGGTVGAGTTGPVPDGWTALRTNGTACAGVVTLAARPDGLPGNALKIVITNSTDMGQYALKLAANISVTIGETYVGKHRVYVEASSGLEELTLFIDPNLAGQKRCECGSGAIGGVSIPLAGDYLTLETPPITIDAAISTINLTLQPRLSSTGSATIWIMPGEPSLRRI